MICVVTGSRAEYGILTPLLHELRQLDLLQLIVCGSHVLPEFGRTIEGIRDAKFDISATIYTTVAGGDPNATALSVGLGVSGFSDAFRNLRPQLIVLLGDRFEIFSAAIAAHFLRIPVAHIHGGEVTHGSLDDSVRHCITKLARYHFVSNDDARRRVEQLGESPDRIQVVGAPGLDSIRERSQYSRASLMRELALSELPPFLLVTYHPVTNDDEATERELRALTRALAVVDSFALITGANADAGGMAINQAFSRYQASHPNRAHFALSLGSEIYHAALANCEAVVGNSSSGIIEAPYFGKPTVNIGNRQSGRPLAQSIINASGVDVEIVSAIKRVTDPAFQAEASRVQSLFGDGQATFRIVQALHRIIEDGSDNEPKVFFDVTCPPLVPRSL